MKKNITLLFLISLLSGCSAVYELNITHDTINEKILFSYKDNEYSGEKLTSLNEIEDISVYLDPFREELYEKTYLYKNDDKDLDILYSYNYDISENSFKGLNVASQCYEAMSIVPTNTGILISTTDEFKCAIDQYNYIEDVTIKIVLKDKNMKSIQDNSDEHKDNVFIWKINKDNYKYKPILFEYTYIYPEPIQEKHLGIFRIIIFVVSIVVVVAVIGLFIYLKSKKANKM